MKKIGFITTNKMLAQSLAAMIEKYPDLEFSPHVLLNLHQTVLDAEVLRIDIAVMEMIATAQEYGQSTVRLCQNLRLSLPDCRILLLVPQGSKEAREMAAQAVAESIADDYVFNDVSLDYLLAKLLAFC